MQSSVSETKPLVVDLDGTLIRSDLLIESAFSLLGREPQSIFGMIKALFKGKAALKHMIASSPAFDATTLPYDEAVLELIQLARNEGRPVYLASASNDQLVGAVAEHLGVFDGWFGSNETKNLAGKAKAQHLVERFGHQGFDYIGNDKADLAVWSCADKALCVRTPAGVLKSVSRNGREVAVIESKKPTLRTWIKLFRVHQYAKNALVFVPLLTSQSFTVPAILQATLAAIAYSLCASSVYVLNDMVDLAADRGHPTKRNRPLANGSIPLIQAMAVVPLLAIAGLAVAASVSWMLLAVVVAYMALTTAYTFWLKRKLMVDVVALSLLYSIRVIGGAVAIGVVLSPWLLGFSMFIFTSLALMKRYIELAVRLDGSLSDPSNRNYKIGDLPVVMSLAAAAGFNAVTVMALYVSSEAVNTLYSRPALLWMICPLLMYWIGRALVMAHRRLIDDDPVVFAIKDRVSRITIVCVLVIAAAAI